MEKKQTEFKLESKRNVEQGERETRKKFGKFWIREHPSGSVTIFGNGIRGRGIYAPPKRAVIRRAKREYQTQGELSQTTRTYVKRWGLLNPQNPQKSLHSGLEVLQIQKYHPQAVRLSESDKAFRSFWKSHLIRTHDKKRLVHPSSRLPKIKDFEKKHTQEYQWITTNVGMYRFMEQRHPGLYYYLSEKTTIQSIDFNKLREEVLSLINSGVSVSKNYLGRSPEPSEKRVGRRIGTILKNREAFNSKPNYLPPEIKTFGGIVSYLSGIPQDRLRKEAESARDCGKLAEKFVECYVFLAIRAGYDPLNLNLSDIRKVSFKEPLQSVQEADISDPAWSTEVHFNNNHTRYTFGKNKQGIADGRVGDNLIEVKVGARKFTERYTKQVIEKYSPNGVWNDGTPISESILFLHQEPRFYESAKPAIINAGIRIIDFQQFHSAFSLLLNKTDHNYDLIQRVEPQVNIQALLAGHRNLNLENRMNLFCREGFSTQREWYEDMISGIIEEAIH
ncbi:MAG: hypothetical protein AABX11_07820 [Nanoarchaeota archaeon]